MNESTRYSAAMPPKRYRHALMTCYTILMIPEMINVRCFFIRFTMTRKIITLASGFKRATKLVTSTTEMPWRAAAFSLLAPDADQRSGYFSLLGFYAKIGSGKRMAAHELTLTDFLAAGAHCRRISISIYIYAPAKMHGRREARAALRLRLILTNGIARVFISYFRAIILFLLSSARLDNLRNFLTSCRCLDCYLSILAECA